VIFSRFSSCAKTAVRLSAIGKKKTVSIAVQYARRKVSRVRHTLYRPFSLFSGVLHLGEVGTVGAHFKNGKW